MANKVFFPGNYSMLIDTVILMIRIVAGGFMLTHGWGKFLKLTGPEIIKFSDPIGIGVTTSLSLVVFAEVICAVLVILGFATRLVTIPIMITMAVAAFVVNAGNPFNAIELSLLYLFIFFIITLTGAGRFSIDQLIYRMNSSKGKRNTGHYF